MSTAMPRWIASWNLTVPASWSIEALTTGNCLSASTVALAKNGMNESFTPSLASNEVLCFARRAAIRVTSASMTVVS